MTAQTRFHFVGCVFALVVALASQVGASPVVTAVTSPSQLSTSTTHDLILSGSPTLTSTSLLAGAIEYGNFPSLNDGVYMDATGGTNLPLSVVLTQGSQVAYVLNTSASPTGYDLTSFVSTSAWTDGRVGQEYSLYYTTVSAPATPILLATVDKPVVGGSQQVTISDTTGILAQNVYALGVLINNNAGNNSDLDTVYQEFVARGFATPEPSSIVLAICAMAACAVFGRRKK